MLSEEQSRVHLLTLLVDYLQCTTAFIINLLLLEVCYESVMV